MVIVSRLFPPRHVPKIVPMGYVPEGWEQDMSYSSSQEVVESGVQLHGSNVGPSNISNPVTCENSISLAVHPREIPEASSIHCDSGSSVWVDSCRC